MSNTPKVDKSDTVRSLLAKIPTNSITSERKPIIQEIAKEKASDFKSRKTYVQTIFQFNEFVTKFKNEKLIEFINMLKSAPLIKNDNSSLKAIQAEGTQSVLAVYNGIKNSFRVVAKRIAEMSKNKVTIENNC